MFFAFDTQKTLQAIGVVLRTRRAAIAGKIRILKLLYIADREAIRETGRPILGFRTVAMDRGPLHSAVLDLINGTHVDEAKFSACFDKYGYMVQMSEDPGVDQLSPYEIKKIEETSEKYAQLDDWELSNITHSFAEWIKNQAAGSSKTIPIEDIIRAVGRGEDEQLILCDLAAEMNADRLFGERSL